MYIVGSRFALCALGGLLALAPLSACTSHGGQVTPDPTGTADLASVVDGGSVDGRGAQPDLVVSWDQPWNRADRGMYGGKPQALVMDPTNPALMYALANRKFFQSSDGGTSWTAAGVGLPLTSFFTQLTISPSHPEVLYVAESLFVYRSADRGASWSSLNKGLPMNLAAFALLATPDAVYLHSGQGTYKLLEGGDTWSASSSGLPAPPPVWTETSNRFLSWDPRNAQRVYAMIDDQLFRTQDGGGAWAAADSSLRMAAAAEPQYGFTALGIDPKNPDTLYAATSGKVYKSTDTGTSWTRASTGLPADFSSDSGARFVFDPNNPALLYLCTMRGLFRSTDGASNWTQVSPGFPPFRNTSFYYSVASLLLDPRAPTTLFAATSVGIQKSVDGGAHFSIAMQGINGLEPTALAAAPLRPLRMFAATTNGAIFRSEDGGAGWSQVWLSDNTYENIQLAVDPKNVDVVYAGVRAGVLKTSDGGQTWKLFKLALANESSKRPIAVDPSSPQTVYAGDFADGYLKRSKNGADFYRVDGLGAPPEHIEVDPLSSDIVYARYANILFKSTDGGVSWNGAPLATGTLDSMWIDPRLPANLLGCGSNGLYKSQDRAATWTKLGYANGCASMMVAPSDTQRIYFTPDVGRGTELLLRSSDGGGTWLWAAGLLPILDLRMLAVDPTSPQIAYVGTPLGLYKTVSGGL